MDARGRLLGVALLLAVHNACEWSLEGFCPVQLRTTRMSRLQMPSTALRQDRLSCRTVAVLAVGAADINALLRRALHVEPNEHLAQLAQVRSFWGDNCVALQFG